MKQVIFNEIWCVGVLPKIVEGEHPLPMGMVAKEINSGRKIHLDGSNITNEFQLRQGEETLIVAFGSTVEMGCFLSMGWSLPVNLLDLFTEFRCEFNGLLDIDSFLFGDALRNYGVIELDDPDPEIGNMTECENYVDKLTQLYFAMINQIDIPRALYRGDYQKVAAQIERNGIPIDMITLSKLKENWKNIKIYLISSIGSDYNIFMGTIFPEKAFCDWLVKEDIPWPRLESGRLNLEEETFIFMSNRYPSVAPLRDLRGILSKLTRFELPVGVDGRNRCPSMTFRSKTGRNQPSNAKYIFGQSAWTRNLIKPKKDHGIAYIDWEQQEFGIAAALSKDQYMIDAYNSNDPYLQFAIQAGAIPETATKQSHPRERNLYKECALAVQYGMGAEKLAVKIEKTKQEAQFLLDKHHEIYNDFWQWSENVVNQALITRKMRTEFNWKYHLSLADVNIRTLQNFPMQGNGAEMLRLACILLSEKEIKICGMIHDAVLIEAPANKLLSDIKLAQFAMEEASEIILDGFKLRTDVYTIIYPKNYADERGKPIWKYLNEFLFFKKNS